MIDIYLNELAMYRENRNNYTKEERKLLRAALKNTVEGIKPGELEISINAIP